MANGELGPFWVLNKGSCWAAVYPSILLYHRGAQTPLDVSTGDSSKDESCFSFPCTAQGRTHRGALEHPWVIPVPTLQPVGLDVSPSLFCVPSHGVTSLGRISGPWRQDPK